MGVFGMPNITDRWPIAVSPINMARAVSGSLPESTPTIVCAVCGVSRAVDDISVTVETTLEPGYEAKVKRTVRTVIDAEYDLMSGLSYKCLVCGYVWNHSPAPTADDGSFYEPEPYPWFNEDGEQAEGV